MNYNANEQRSKPLAIVGYSCCFPGGIDSPDRFWQLLHSGGSVIGEVPDSRLPREFYYVPSEKTRRGKCYSLIGACIDYDHYRNRVNEFLAKIPHSNTFSHDEEHLLSLYVAAEAFRSAGYDPMNIPQRRTGVYVGHSRESKGTVDTNFSSCIESVLEYIEEIPEFAALDKTIRENVWNDVLDAFFRRYPPLSPENRQCLCLHYAAKNISKAFGLSGPAMIFNCACASSLVGIASAADALGQNKIDMALVGGASYVKLESMIHFSKAQALSESGSKPFDSSADGLVPSEGHAYVVLKTLEKALEFGDNVIAVIHGVGVSSDGKGKGLWAPRKEGQLKALQRAYQQTHIRPGDLDYIEAHATSTKRGDATELDTIQSFLKSESVSNKKIFIGSSKANLGHTLESAGLAGLIKILLSMKNETIPAQINIAHLDESFSRNETAIEVPLVNTPWKRSENSPRTAAVSAFGIGGVNAHAIVQDFFDSSSSHNKEKRVSSPPKDNIPIAVIGMGCVLPGVSDLSDFEALLQTGNDPKAASSPDRKELFMNHRRESKRYNSRQNKEMRQLPGGYLTDYSYDWKRHKIPPVQLKHANPLQFIILDAVDKALDDAGFSDALPVPTDTAVVVGSRFDSDYTTALQMSIRCPELEKEIAVQLKNHGVDPVKAKTISGSFSKMLLDRHTALSDETGSFTTTSLAARIVKTYNLMGGYWVIDAGACSSLAALEIAVNALRERRVDMAICVGGQQCMGRLSREEMFLHDGDLFPLAEGAGALVLKRQDDALRDNNHIRALIHGVSFCQGNDMAETTRQSVKATMESSVPNIDTVGFVELASPCNTPASQGHMTGLTEALSSMRRNIPSGSLANQIGNLLGASGIASVIKTILQLKNESAHPCAIVTNIDRDGAVGSLLIERGGAVPPFSIISREEFTAINTAVNGKPPIDVGTTVCQRFVQRIVPAPCETSNLRLGPVLLVGQNAIVEHL
ncbi:MAG: polyketide synthase, partial [Planctomycetaceae bacterium]|nr:polyketide synthase [Planctomycetaceae bacterium]